MLLNIFLTPIILKYSGDKDYGTWLLLISVINYLTLADLGVSTSLIRKITDSSVTDDSINRWVNSALNINLGVFVLFILAGAITYWFIPHIINRPISFGSPITITYFILVIASAISVVAPIFSAVLASKNLMYIESILKNSTLIFSLILSIILTFLGFGILGLGMAFFVQCVLYSVGIIYFSYRENNSLRLGFSYIQKVKMRSLLHFGGYFQVSRLALTVALSTDNLIIAKFLDVSAIVTYTTTSKVIVFLTISVIPKLANAYFPALCELYNQKQTDRIKAIFQKLIQYYTRFIIVAILLVLLLNRPFVSVWVGSQYFGGVGLNLVFAALVIINTIVYGLTTFVYAGGDMKQFTVISIFEAILNLVLSIVFVKYMGLAGVALGTLVSKLFTSFWFVVYKILRDTGLQFWEISKQAGITVLRSLLPAFISVVLIWIARPYTNNWFMIAVLFTIPFIMNLFFFEVLAILRSPLLSRNEKVKTLFSTNIFHY